MEYKLQEVCPSTAFSDCHYIGNGRLGASIYGEVPIEHIELNEDTLWSGYEKRYTNEQYYDKLQEARKLTLAGQYLQANQLMDDFMYGGWGQSYQPLATLNFSIGLGSNLRNRETKRLFHMTANEMSAYQRVLDLDTAIATVSYQRDGIRYQRDAFVSKEYDVIAIKLSAEGGELCFAVSMQSKLMSTVRVEDGFVSVQGRAPDNVEPQYVTIEPGVTYTNTEDSDSIRFASQAMISQTDGEISCDGVRLYVNHASYAVVLIAASTNYAGYGIKRNKDISVLLAAQKALLQKAKAVSYETLKAAHINDYQSLYHRVSLSLGESLSDHLPTSTRLSLCAKNAQDPSLAALQLQYARYLMISGSRPGTQPLNLQGIWNELVRPAWSCNLTANINVQMNYWIAEPLQLSECHMPLFDYILDLADHGAHTAKDFFHAPGWVANHNLDLWRHSVPVCETSNFGYWIFGGVWLCQHVWTHYAYTQDKAFLRKFYPVLRGAAEFVLSQLVEDENGVLVTAPSTSPENRHLITGAKRTKDIIDQVGPHSRMAGGEDAITSICKASTVDMTMTRELFSNLNVAAQTLGIEDDLLEKTQVAISRLMPYQIGRYGQLMEWSEDFEESVPGMEHLSHLYSVYPANIINQEETPQLFEAAKASLRRRFRHGALHVDWAGAWGICLAARLGLPDLCEAICDSIGTDYGSGMLTKTFKSQIDAILGQGAGIAEMLLQSHLGKIVLLPTCPASWADGSFTGFVARGGFVVDAAWQRGTLQAARIVSTLGNDVVVQAKGLRGVQMPTGEIIDASAEQVRFSTEKKMEYQLLFA